MPSASDEVATPADEVLVETKLLVPVEPNTAQSSTAQKTSYSQRNVDNGRETARRQRRIRNHAEQLRALREAVASNCVDYLPPLPSPDSSRHWGTLLGSFVIICVTASIAGVTHVVALVLGDLPQLAWWVCLCVMYSMAVCALMSLSRIVCGDPGFVHRSEDVCFPVPTELLLTLESGESAIQNIKDTDDDQTYCVRCYVWRPNTGVSGRKSHHCSICQRCVVDFDHHCPFYGRCVAGHFGSTIETWMRAVCCYAKAKVPIEHDASRCWQGNCFHFVFVPVIGCVGFVIGALFIIISLIYKFD